MDEEHASGPRRALLKSCGISAAVILLLWSPTFITEGFGLRRSEGLGMVLVLSQVSVCALSVALLIGSLLSMLLARTKRKTAVGNMACALTCIVFTIACGRLSYVLRGHAMNRIADRAQPLIVAIEGYNAKYGHPPQVVENLIPDFLEQIPGTGHGAYPEFNYQTPAQFSTNNDTWGIQVWTPLGGINFDEFYYNPSHKYDERPHRGAIERRGDWAYMHE